MEQYLIPISTFILGLSGTIITWLRNKKESKQVDINTLLKQWEVQYHLINSRLQEAEEREKECLENYATMIKELNALKASVTLLKASAPTIPIPMWVKDTNGIMLSLNDAYEQTFLKPLGKTRNDYIGKTDTEVWGEEIAKEFRINDNIAALSDEPISVFENVNIGNGIFKEYNIIKYRNKIADLVISIAGIALPKPKK